LNWVKVVKILKHSVSSTLDWLNCPKKGHRKESKKGQRDGFFGSFSSSSSTNFSQMRGNIIHRWMSELLIDWWGSPDRNSSTSTVDNMVEHIERNILTWHEQQGVDVYDSPPWIIAREESKNQIDIGSFREIWGDFLRPKGIRSHLKFIDYLKKENDNQILTLMAEEVIGPVNICGWQIYGTPDLYMETENHYIVVDFKTGWQAKEKESRGITQLLMYAFMISQEIIGLKDDKKWLLELTNSGAGLNIASAEKIAEHLESKLEGVDWDNETEVPGPHCGMCTHRKGCHGYHNNPNSPLVKIDKDTIFKDEWIDIMVKNSTDFIDIPERVERKQDSTIITSVKITGTTKLKVRLSRNSEWWCVNVA